MNRTLQFEQIESLVHHARKVLVVSDYDGTLAGDCAYAGHGFLA